MFLPWQWQKARGQAQFLKVLLKLFVTSYPLTFDWSKEDLMANSKSWGQNVYSAHGWVGSEGLVVVIMNGNLPSLDNSLKI